MTPKQRAVFEAVLKWRKYIERVGLRVDSEEKALADVVDDWLASEKGQEPVPPPHGVHLVCGHRHGNDVPCPKANFVRFPGEN